MPIPGVRTFQVQRVHIIASRPGNFWTSTLDALPNWCRRGREGPGKWAWRGKSGWLQRARNTPPHHQAEIQKMNGCLADYEGWRQEEEGLPLHAGVEQPGVFWELPVGACARGQGGEAGRGESRHQGATEGGPQQGFG